MEKKKELEGKLRNLGDEVKELEPKHLELKRLKDERKKQYRSTVVSATFIPPYGADIQGGRKYGVKSVSSQTLLSKRVVTCHITVRPKCCIWITRPRGCAVGNSSLAGFHRFVELCAASNRCCKYKVKRVRTASKLSRSFSGR